MILPLNGVKPTIHPTAFIHPSAEVSGNVTIGAHVSVWGGCILRGDVDLIQIGADTNIQDGTIIHTSHGFPTIVGRAVTVGHKVMIHGSTIEDECLIGMSATLLDGSHIERHCMVGAGALVKEKDRILSGQLAVGLPAKAVRAVRADEIMLIQTRAQEYIELAGSYQQALQVKS